MSHAKHPNEPDSDPFAFLKLLGDPSGPSTSSRPGLPGLEDSDDEDLRYGLDDPDHEEIPGESPSTSQSTTPGYSQDKRKGQGNEEEENEDWEEMSEGEREFERERRRREAEMSDDDDDGDGRGRGSRRGEGRQYELRRNINREAFVGSGYSDHDQSGNYDPEEESDEELDMERVGRGRGRKRMSETKRDKKGKGKAKARRSESRVGEDDDADDEVDNALDEDVAGMDGLDLNGASQSQDPEVEDDEDEDEDEDEDDDDDISIEDVAANNSDVDPDEARLRKAAKKRMQAARDPKPNTPPKPQSCISCTKLRLDCSINDEPGSYPCLSCLEVKCGCILPTPYTADQRRGTKKALTKQKAAEKKAARELAKKKREQMRQHELKKLELQRKHKNKQKLKACTCCKDVDRKCSNEDLAWDEIRGRQCKRCVKKMFICELSPGAWETAEAPEPQQEEERRPLPRGQRPLPTFGSPAFDVPEQDEDDVNPINNVGPDGEPRRKRYRKSKKSKLSQEIDQDQSPGETFIPPPGYAKKQITTHFAHPLVFNAPLQPHDQESCLGCDLHTPAFAIFGHPAATPWVTLPSPYPSPNTTVNNLPAPFQYTEIPFTAGHTETTDHEKTNVCKLCTFSRQKTLFCPGHKLAGIKNLPKPRDFNFDAAYGHLLGDQQAGFRTNEARFTKWCSVCPAPAFLECCRKGPLQVQGEREGCGLLLCEICAVSLLAVPDANAQKAQQNEDTATKEVQVLLRDVKKVNIAARAAQVNPSLPVRERSFVQVRRELDDVIAEAKEMCENGGGKGGKYMDGVRADVELISRNGWLWEWMEMEAETQRVIEWAKSGVAGANRGAPNVAGGGAGGGAEGLR